MRGENRIDSLGKIAQELADICKSRCLSRMCRELEVLLTEIDNAVKLYSSTALKAISVLRDVIEEFEKQVENMPECSIEEKVKIDRLLNFIRELSKSRQKEVLQ